MAGATLEDAIQLAAQAHRGQRRFNGEPYILHPLRMMVHLAAALRADSATPAEVETTLMAAVLHDVVEDTACTLNDLRQAGYPEAVVAAVDALTRRQGESYQAFIARLKPNALARQVKLADLRDNMDVLQLPAIQEQDVARLRQYRAAWDALAGER